MSDRKMYREEARPTLPPVRDLFRDELARSPRPQMNVTPPWIVPSSRPEQNFERSFSRDERRQDYPLDGPGVQRSTSSATYYSPPAQQRYDGRTASRSFLPDNLSSSMSQHQLPPQYHARSTSQADQTAASHDRSPPTGSHLYTNLAPQSSSYTYASTSRGSYSECCTKDHYKETMAGPIAPEMSRLPSTTPLKYPCGHCGKGFTRPSSLKIHLNSHTGEKPFACSFKGCGRSFSVLSNMRRHARVHAEAPSRHQESSSDEHSQ